MAESQEKRDIIGLSRDEMAEALAALGEKSFRVKQVWHWLYHQGARDFSAMTTLSKTLREKLEAHFYISRPDTLEELTSKDRTRKWLFGFEDGKSIETVYIPEEDRGAVCISSQVGCAMNCSFCHTGTQKCERNLTAAEIVGQFMAARDSYGEWPTPTDETRYLSNVVLMGMGEPLNNYNNVVKACKILMDPEGLSLSKRRITLSTSGIVPKMRDCARDLGVKMAVSLHAATDELRDQIMPVNKKWPLKELMQACRDYREIAGQRQYITFEYLLLKGVNDSPADARALAKLVKGIGAKFNLIMFNKWPDAPYDPPSVKQAQAFARILENEGYAAPLRVPRGQDIMAACGQLKSESSE